MGTRFKSGLSALSMAVLASFSVAHFAAAADLSNLIAHWNFEETSGFLLADSTGNHDAFTVGPIFEDDINNPDLIAAGFSDVPRFEGSANTGAIGNAWSFPGNNAFDDGDVGVQPTNTAAFTSLGPSYTYSIWFKSDIDLAATNDTPSTLFSISNNDPNNTPNQGREVLIRLNDDPNIPGATVGGAHYLARSDAGGNFAVSATTTVQVDTAPSVWHHIAVAQSGTGWKMYLDGVLNNSGTEVVSPSAINANVVNIGRNDDDTGFGGTNVFGHPYDPGEWTFGGDPNGPALPNEGLLDDISIWDAPLNAIEVANIYNGGLAGMEAPQAFASAPGDFDFDGDVDGTDLLIWQRGVSPSPADLADWEANYGLAPAVASGPGAVPEPSSLFMLALAGLGCLASRRTR